MSHLARIRFVPFAVLDQFDHLAAVAKRALSQVGFWSVWTVTVMALAIAAECSTLAAAPDRTARAAAMEQSLASSQSGAKITQAIVNFSYTEPAADAPTASRAGAQADE